MVSINSKTLSLNQSRIQLNELGKMCDSVEPFTKLILHSGKPAIQLHCTVPTWSPSSDFCLDLYDLHELRSRFLLFIHDLLHALRSSGITASYCLAPASSPFCLVCALTPGLTTSKITSTTFDFLNNTRLNNGERVLLADMEFGPCLVIT